jgi:hypothetical protein
MYDNPKLQNDIALIKVNRAIKFNGMLNISIKAIRHFLFVEYTLTDSIFIEFIKPICLMTGKLLRKNFVGQMAEVAGWGVYDISTYVHNLSKSYSRSLN